MQHKPIQKTLNCRGCICQFVAGPIVRYSSIASYIAKHSHSVHPFASGVRRFVYGLAKKLLIANPLGHVADTTFTMSDGDLTLPLTWIGVRVYTLQVFLISLVIQIWQSG